MDLAVCFQTVAIVTGKNVRSLSVQTTESRLLRQLHDGRTQHPAEDAAYDVDVHRKHTDAGTARKDGKIGIATSKSAIGNQLRRRCSDL